MLVDEVIARLEDYVGALAHRVHGAADLSERVKRGNLPQQRPAAFVLPLGLRGGQVTASSANVFHQMFGEVIGVVLVFESAGDGTGARALPDLDQLIDAVILALAGWGPDAAIGVFKLDAGQILGMPAGTVIYQLNFSIQAQLRIA